jgi:hypothetical protein
MNDDKPFDAVRTMREIREQIDRELAGKTYEQQKRYIREHVPPPPTPGHPNAA